MDEIQLLRALDPVTGEKLDAFPAPEVFEQLSCRLARVPAGETSAATPTGQALWRWRERGRRRLGLGSLTAAVAVAAAALAVSLVVTEGVAPSPRWVLVAKISPPWKQVSGSIQLSDSLTCPSATTCYAQGLGALKVTRDGGQTWQPAPTKGGTPVSNVACAGAADCAFLEAGLHGKPMFLETSDAGRTWASHPAPAELSVYQLPPGALSGIPGIDLSCSSASTCTAVAPVSQPGGSAFVTEDGGRTWSATPLSIAPRWVQCLPDGRCASTGPEGAIYSTDNGLHWSPATAPQEFLAGLTLPGALSCGGRETCMALSSPRSGRSRVAIYASRNGGESWSAVEAKGLPAGKQFTGLACPTASECWAGGTNLGSVPGLIGDFGGAVMLSSADRGRTWQGTELPKGITGIFALSCPSATTCFALGSDGPVSSSFPQNGPQSPQNGPRSLVLLAYRAPGR